MIKRLQIEKLITNRDGGSLDRYLSDISKTKLLSPEEEADLAKRIKLGDQAARERLIRGNLRFVVSCAKKYENLGLPLNDLINEGNIGLMRAALDFDESRGFKFISYAVWWIRHAILKALMTHARMIRLPENIVKTISQLKQKSGELEPHLERTPTMDELAVVMELPAENIKYHLLHNFSISSIDQTIAQDDGEVCGQIEDKENPPTDALVTDSLNTELNRLLEILPERDAAILKDLYGIDMQFPIAIHQVVSSRGISRSEIRKIMIQSIKTLREKVKETGITYQ